MLVADDEQPPRGESDDGTGDIADVEDGADTSVMDIGPPPPSLASVICFLSLHLVWIAAEIFAMIFYAVSDNWVFTWLLLVPFSLSGVFCTYAAWSTTTPRLGRTCLPLKDRPCFTRWLLAIPYGWCQGIIVVLELEEFCARRRSDRLPLRQRLQRAAHTLGSGGTQQWLDKVHCKAVNGAFEGLTASAVLLYSYWGLSFPKADPIMYLPQGWGVAWTNCVLQTLGFVAFISAGFSILELDFAISRCVQHRMRNCIVYKCVHWLFRTSEVISRVFLLVGFMVLGRKRLPFLWWLPPVMDVLVSVFLVDMHGGCEVTALVRVLCAVPCSFANIFQFIDTPYKRRAARKLTKAFAIRNLVEMVLFPALLFAEPRCPGDIRYLMEIHGTSIYVSLSAIPIYWVLQAWYLLGPMKREMPVDIFTACERADVREVMALVENQLTIDLNVFDIDGKTPLMLAVLRGRANRDGYAEAEVVRILTEEGACPCWPMFEDQRFLWKIFWLPQRRRWTAVHMAAWRGNAEVMEALIEGLERAGQNYPEESLQGLLDSSFTDHSGETPLHVAAAYGHVEVTRQLLAFSPSWVDIRNKHHQRALDLASSDEVRRMLEEPVPMVGGAAMPRRPLLEAADSASPNANRASVSRKEKGPMKVPIVTSFSRDPCRAPGLSSYVASCGGGTLAKVFCTKEQSRLCTILEEAQLAMDHEASRGSGHGSAISDSPTLDNTTHANTGSAGSAGEFDSECGSAAASSIETPPTVTPLTSCCTETSVGSPDLSQQGHASMTSMQQQEQQQQEQPQQQQQEQQPQHEQKQQVQQQPNQPLPPYLQQPPTQPQAPPQRPELQLRERSGSLRDNTPTLESIEPCDADGNGLAEWRAIVEDRQRVGKSLGSMAFLYVDDAALIGRGSFGVVWRARDKQTGALYAVKNVQAASSGTALSSTADREYQMSQYIRHYPHPCIVRLFQVFHFPEIRLYMIIMELATGGDLLKWVQKCREKALQKQADYEPPARAYDWIGQVFLGLEHLHLKMNALLRDLKPENVVITEQGLAKLTDFGFGRFGAESPGEGMWSFGMPPGSPGYIAPESLLQQPIGYQADLYSFGVLIWVVLTGGVTYDPSPRPPVGSRKARNDFTAHTNDYQYLRQCLNDPERHGARPFPNFTGAGGGDGGAKDLVRRLVQRRPAERPLHAEIRQTPMLRSLGLPQTGASSKSIDAWLSHCVAEAAGSQ